MEKSKQDKQRIGIGVFLFVFQIDETGNVLPNYEMHHWMDTIYTEPQRLAALVTFRDAYKVPTDLPYKFVPF